MAKYLKYQQKSRKKPEMNPIWRGIGCILIIVVPLLAFGFMAVFVPPIVASGYVPQELLGYVRFPDWAMRAPVLGPIAGFFGSIENLWVDLIALFILLVVLSGLFSVIYSMVYQLVGPPRYTAVDVPPSEYKGKAYKR